MKPPIRLRELDAVPLVDVLGRTSTADEREAFRRHVAQLSARLRSELGLREDPFAVVEANDGTTLQTRGVAGTIRLGSRLIDVRPKHVEPTVDDSWQTVLLLMVERVTRRRALYTASRRLKYRVGTFLDTLAMGLAMELEEATRYTEIRSYRSHREESGQLRGRMLVSEQLRSAVLKPHKIICEVDELSADNPANRLLHWAARQLAAMASQPIVRRELSVQCGKLPYMSPPFRAPSQLSFKLPRQYQHYAGAIELATAFAKGLTTAHGSSNIGGAGFLVGTERLFESFVERSLATVLAGTPWSVTAQERAAFAHPEIVGSGRSYFSKPDNVVHHDDSAVLLIDAKYKRFQDATEFASTGRPSNGDLYQMVAACVAHGSPRALLVYPRMSSADCRTDWAPTWWQIPIGGTRLRIGAVTIPVQMLADNDGLTSFDRRLRALVSAASQYSRPAPNLEMKPNE